MRLTESEAAAAGPLLLAAAVMAMAWLLDGAGVPLRPAAVLGLAALTTIAALWALFSPRAASGARVSWSARRLGGFLAVFGGFTAYVSWLAWPSLLPVTQGPDLVHHLTLIHFIQRRHALPHDPALGAYLGEMVSYTPGSHVLAALAGEWLRADAVRIVHPLQAVFVGLKAGVIYNMIHRAVARARSDVLLSAAGALLLLLPYRYLLEPVTVFGFYSQVIAETFAVAMLWAMVAWHQQASRRTLGVAAACGVAIVLCWPVYFAAPALAIAIVIVLHAVQVGRSFRTVLGDILVALGPGAAVMAVFSLRHAASAGILRSGGSVLVPSVEVFGWPFLLLAAGGLVIAAARARTTAPVLAFAGACMLQIGGLAAAQLWLGATNLYLAGKAVFLLVSPLTILAATALAYALTAIWPVRAPLNDADADAELELRATAGAPDGAIANDRAMARGTPRGAGAAAVVVAALLVGLTGLPLRPIESPFSQPVHGAGLWAKANVPASCVEYLVDRWVTGYWLHLDVLGNARASARMQTETFEYRPAVSRWILRGGLLFAIVENLSEVPGDARRTMAVMYRSGEAAVVQRADGLGACPQGPPPIDRVGR